MVRVSSDKFDLSTLADLLEASKTRRRDGSVSFRGGHFDEHMLTFLSSLEFSGQIPEAER